MVSCSGLHNNPCYQPYAHLCCYNSSNCTFANLQIPLSADGSVYVTGQTAVAGQSGNLLLRKYAPNGALVWMKTYKGVANSWDLGYGVAVAADGSVYVTGMTEVAGQDGNLLLR